MGTLRTLFAISVVFSHCYGPVLIGGRNAVQLFYMISGFVISYVLTEASSYKSIGSFYLNRYLRLYPIYATVALLTVGAFLVHPKNAFWNVFRGAPFGADVLLVMSNVSLIGQDWLLFADVRNHHLAFTTNAWETGALLFMGAIIPQAWTLGVELSFYAIAPFVLPRRGWIYALLAVSLVIRLLVFDAGLGHDFPWSYGFFPSELALFLLGSLSHQVLLPRYRKLFVGKLAICSSAATYLLIVLTVVYFLIPVRELYKTICLFAIFLVLVPLTFQFQNRNKFDSWIGSLSYPIYINHMLVILVVGFFFSRAGIKSAFLSTTTIVVGSIVFAIVLEKWIAQPFETIRARIKSGSSGTVRAQAKAGARRA